MAGIAASLALGSPLLLVGTLMTVGLVAILPFVGRAAVPVTAPMRVVAPPLVPGTDEPQPSNSFDEYSIDRNWEIDETAVQIVTVFDALGDMFAACSMDGEIVFANTVFRQFTGVADPVGLTLADIGIHPHAVENGREVWCGEGDTDSIWTWHETAARDPASGLLYMHCIGRDVTAARLAGNELEQARERAEAANRAKTRFLGTVSHEIRTPLNGILGMTHLLDNTEVTPEQASYLKIVRESGQSLLALIEDLLDVTSIEAGRFHLRHEEGDLYELVHGVTELMAARAHEKNIEIAVHIAPDVPHRIFSDMGRLRQVLFNLIGNAIKFTEKGGVLIEVACEDSMLRCSVADTGPGLRAEDRERVFLEFERADDGATRRHGGAGLGLSISARIIEALKGTISVDSTIGKGSTFEFRVPIEAPAEQTSDRAGLPGRRALSKHAVLVLAPKGPVATSLVWTVRDLGGQAEAADTLDDMIAALTRLNLSGRLVTDILIDRRMADQAAQLLESTSAMFGPGVEQTLVIAPEDSRDISQTSETAATAWLVRPVRARSLVDVLTSRDDREDRNRLSNAISVEKLARPGNESTLDILLAEDNPVNALVVRSILAREGHRITVVENGSMLVDEAMNRPDGKNPFDLIITDLSMPVMDGKSAIVMIRAREETDNLSRLPIIVLSADGQAETRDELLSIGADGHAEKPIDPAWLLSLVSMTVRAGKARA
ncbi:signal transduction histidine kinase [Hoeflea marina]|uniref:Sensory/regulatory protein RpfC n=1 Tax=Hoeflea marina TaxID=274592 RepID=A0A317PM11_9HYPH|nr:ATP-binding protein [Hoeflea marina]PWW00087.1 signal transduction histidine kinase [Hoeflea marina]